MALVNGSAGIGTGWSTNVPNYNPTDVVANLKKMLNGEEPDEMQPWYIYVYHRPLIYKLALIVMLLYTHT